MLELPVLGLKMVIHSVKPKHLSKCFFKLKQSPKMATVLMNSYFQPKFACTQMVQMRTHTLPASVLIFLNIVTLIFAV